MTQKLISMSCPSCGGRLQVGLDIRQFNCAHCGAEWRVDRGEGTIALQPITQHLDAINANTSGIKQSSDRIAAELALPRLEKEISELETKLAVETKAHKILSVPVVPPRKRLQQSAAGRIAQIAGKWLLVISTIWMLPNVLFATNGGSRSVNLWIYIFCVSFSVFMILWGRGRQQSSKEYVLYQEEQASRDQLIQQSKARDIELKTTLDAKRAELARHRRILSE